MIAKRTTGRSFQGLKNVGSIGAEPASEKKQRQVIDE